MLPVKKLDAAWAQITITLDLGSDLEKSACGELCIGNLVQN